VRGLYDVTAVQGELLLALARHARRVRVHVPFDPQEPARAAYAYPYIHLWESLVEPGLDVELVFPDPRPGTPSVDIRPATDPASEARLAAERTRSWIDSGVRPEEIAIVTPGPAARIAGLSRELSRRGVPHHARRGAVLTETPALATTLMPFALLDEDFPRQRLQSWISSPLTSRLDPDLLLPAVARGPGTGGTREEWNRALSHARGDSAARLVSGLGVLDDLGRGEVAPAAFWPRYGDVLSRVGLLEGLAASDPAGLAEWESALTELRAALESLHRWTGPARGWRVHRRAILETLGERRTSIGRAGRGVAILDPRDARGLEFRRQILTGLVQGALARPSPGSAVLGDRERRALNDALGRRAFRTSADDALEGDLLLTERLRSTGEEAVLTWPVEDENATPLLPALELERERESRRIPSPEAPAPAEAPAWRVGKDAETVMALQEIERARTSFFGRKPETRRGSGGRWDGVFGPAHAAAVREEIASGAMRWSASALESWSQCGHQFFQRYVLHLRPPDEKPLEAEARTVGDLAHLALARLLQGSRDPWDLDEIRAAVDAVAGGIRDHSRGAPAIWAITRGRVAATVHRYLRHVAAAESIDGFEPVALEEGFGREGSDVPAVTIDSALGPITLRGTLDRLDRHTETGALHVIDYKYSPKRKEHDAAVDPDRCGVERFQLHAYFLAALAWAEVHGHVAKGVTGAIHCIRQPAVAGPLTMPEPELVRGGIAHAIEAAAGGAYDPTPRDPKICRYCDFRRGCRIATVPGVELAEALEESP
jgi:CRISPR/Cas system-associated exonuclease Cas4 (RecB family)